MRRKPLSAPRWRLRFRFRSLLVVITLWGILLSWVAKEQRQSRFERRLGNDLPGLVIYCGPFDSYSRHWDHEPQGWWRDIARIVMGERVFSIRLDFGASADLRQLSRLACLEILAMEDATVRDISPLAESRTLKHLWLRGTSVSDLHPLARLKNLESVGLEETEVTDLTPLADIKTIRLLYLDSTKVKDLAPLVGLENLETLSIFNTSVKDVSAIARLPRLKELTLDSTISEGQVGQLRQALPECKITVRNKRSKKSVKSADTVPQDGPARAGPGLSARRACSGGKTAVNSPTLKVAEDASAASSTQFHECAAVSRAQRHLRTLAASRGSLSRKAPYVWTMEVPVLEDLAETIDSHRRATIIRAGQRSSINAATVTTFGADETHLRFEVVSEPGP